MGGTHLVVYKQCPIDFDMLRAEVGSAIVPTEDGDYSQLYLSTNGEDQVKTFGLLLRTQHAPFDGAGVKIMMNRFLKRLALIISQSETDTAELLWGSEGVNLIPAVYNILAPSEPLPIHPESSAEPGRHLPYYANVEGLVKDIGEMIQVCLLQISFLDSDI